ncbi:MAG: 50S ribosomal protein L3 [Candidatus Omnitrophota bacterium]|nr:MAG: 50S ribosomal protein L3 [Candidatus Omnitrophota bacterium]
MVKETCGKKIGMTQIFDELGNLTGVTLVEIEPACILEEVQRPKRKMVRLGCFKVPANRTQKVKKPLQGYFNKLGTEMYKLIEEVEPENGADFSFLTGQEPPAPKEEEKKAPETKAEAAEAAPEAEAKEEAKEEPEAPAPEGKPQEVAEEKKEEVKRNPREIGVEIFHEGDVVDVRAKTKGRGFAGGMKRHGWHGQPSSHGSTTHRRIGAAGACAYPGEILKGHRMPGHMGNAFRTIKNLKVIKVDPDNNLLFIKGSIPGARGTVIKVKKVTAGAAQVKK